MIFNNLLTIGFFNINGLVGPTASEPDFLELVKSYDILCLTETWHESKDDLINKTKLRCPPGYEFLENARKKRNKRAKRSSGGIVIIYKNIYENRIQTIDTSNDNIFWIKFKGNSIDKQEDLYIATVYNSPINSSYTGNKNNDIFGSIRT